MENRPFEVYINFPQDKTRANFEVLWLGDDVFELLSSDPFNEEMLYGVQVVLKPVADGEYEYVRKHKESGFHTLDFLIPKATAESSELKRCLDSLGEAGCEWEIIFGGMLLIHIPKSRQAELEKGIIEEIQKLP